MTLATELHEWHCGLVLLWAPGGGRGDGSMDPEADGYRPPPGHPLASDRGSWKSRLVEGQKAGSQALVWLCDRSPHEAGGLPLCGCH